MLTKKQIILLAGFMSAVYFSLLFFLLPAEVVAPRIQYKLFFIAKVGFLSISAAITTSILLILFFRYDFIERQFLTLKRFRHLLLLLIKRDFVSRYRRSALGVLWSLLNPLLTMLVMTMVFSFFFRFDIPNFPVYLLSGQIIFAFFSESTTLAMGSVINNAGIIRKVYVPKYIFPISRTFSSLVNLGFSLLAFFLVFTITRAPFYWTMVLIPIPIIYTFVFSVGVGLILSSLAVFFRDLIYLYGVFITLLTYLTPIFYPVSILPEWVRLALGINPMYHFVDYFRRLALWGEIPGLWPNIVCLGLALAALCCGLYVFMSQQDKYILYL